MKADKRNNRGAAARAAGVGPVIVDGKFVEAARKGQADARRGRRGIASLWTHVAITDAAGHVIGRRPIRPDGPEWARVRDRQIKLDAEEGRRYAKRQLEASKPREGRRIAARALAQSARAQRIGAPARREVYVADRVKGRVTPKRAPHWSHRVRQMMGLA
jgi:hypothetical protein